MTAFWCEAPRNILRVSGADALTYLQSQISQDIRGLGDGESTYTFVLQPIGKVDALARLTRVSAEDFLLDTDAGFGEVLAARLNRFKIRVKVEIERLEWSMIAVRGATGPVAGAVPAWSRDDAFDILGEAPVPPEGIAAGTSDDLLVARIEAGWPAMGAEITEATIPAETGVTGAAVSFTKGCYPGQELVERMDSRGSTAPRFVRRLRGTGDLAVGAEVTHDGKHVGAVTSVARVSAEGTTGWIALASVARAVGVGDTVTVGGVGSVVEETHVYLRSVYDIEMDPFASSAQLGPDEYRRLRSECPVAHIPVGWYVSTQAEVLQAMQLVDTFVASFRAPGVIVPDEEQFINEIQEPRHGRVRKIINASVAHHKAMRTEPFIRELCNEYLDQVLASGTADLVADFVAPVPINVIAQLLGVPRQDWASFWRWSDEVVEGTYPTQYRNERGSGLAGAHPEFTAYVDGLIAARRSEHGNGDSTDDLLSRLLTTEIEGRHLTDVEVRTQLVFLIISGNETTRHLIANLMVTLATRPDIFAALQADRSLVERAIEESLRLQPPIHMLLRNVMGDTDVLGRQMCAGEKIVYGIASANRDDSLHADSDEFRLDRTNFREHVAFGGGSHVCPGSSLARLEARVALEVVLDRVASIEVEPGWTFRKTPVFWANGPVDLPVRVTAR